MANLIRGVVTWCLLSYAVCATAVEATYSVRFETLWNRATHPNNYPSSAHFSPLIGSSHSDNVRFWAPGELATTGIENVAEIGLASVFRGEINSAIGAGTALERIEIARNLFSGQSGVSNVFTVNDEHPLVTLATMVAPSSDWFVGVHDFDLREGAGYLSSHVIEFSHFYDAGTEEGDRFSLSNPATFPREPIRLVSGAEAAAPFHGSGASSLDPVARLTFTRESITGLPGDANGDGRVDGVDYAAWRDQYGSAAGGSADFNDDGRVDAADYTVWRDNAAIPAAAIPEPGPLSLLMGVGVVATTRRRVMG